MPTTYTFMQVSLTLKAPITTAADDSCFFFYFSEKTSLNISCESSAWQMIHMKCQDLFSPKNNKKNFECCLLQILLGALRVKIVKWHLQVTDFSFLSTEYFCLRSSLICINTVCSGMFFQMFIINMVERSPVHLNMTGR